MPEIRPYPMEAWDNHIEDAPKRHQHTHGGNELMLICTLGATVIHHGVEVPASAGTLFLHLPDESHGLIGDGAPTRILVINYEPDIEFESGFPSLATTASRQWHLDDHQMAVYLELFTRLQVELDGQRTGRIEAASALIRLLLVNVVRFSEPQVAAISEQSVGPVDSDVHQLRRAIDLRRQGSSSGALHEMVDNYDSLRHRFRRTYGESPNHMLSRLRIEKAKHMLSSSDESMSAIASHVGYARQHEFSRAFHRLVGCTPHRLPPPIQTVKNRRSSPSAALPSA